MVGIRRRGGADDTITYHRALRAMAREIDPEAEKNVETMSQLTSIVSRWFSTHELHEQTAFLRRLAAEVR